VSPRKTTELDIRGAASIEIVSSQEPHGGKQFSVAGMIAYTVLWALIISLFRFAIRLEQGTYTITDARLSDALTLTATGLLFVAIGLPIAILIGRKRHAVPISIGCFFVGFIAIPILIVVLVTIDSLGVIDLDI
jgi:hypothetical protein